MLQFTDVLVTHVHTYNWLPLTRPLFSVLYPPFLLLDILALILL